MRSARTIIAGRKRNRVVVERKAAAGLNARPSRRRGAKLPEKTAHAPPQALCGPIASEVARLVRDRMCFPEILYGDAE